MSAIHVRQIKAFLDKTFEGKINMKDWTKKAADSQEITFLSRSLAAFSIMHLAGCDAESAASSVVDGGKDNGIDAIFYERRERILYLAQSKWKQSGSGSFTRGDLQKFLKGIQDLINERFSKFNKKVQSKAEDIDEALNDSDTKIVIILAYTGKEGLSDDVRQDLHDFLRENNDATDVMFSKVLDQKNLYYSIAQNSKGAPIDVEVMLYEWGQTREPFQAFYGQVCVAELADWWEKHNTDLFAPNIRTYLGETGVNSAIFETLKSTPNKFWYYNNGITVLCSSIRKKLIGGSTRDSGVFDCKDIRVVNGAQTVGSAARAYTLYPESVQQAKVFIRFISLENCPEDFDKEVTRSNNTQNRIDSRDFVALDPEQERIKNELRLEGIKYVYKSGDLILDEKKGFNIEEAALARACLLEDGKYAVMAKGKISKLWHDIEKAPYKALFNRSVTGPLLWKNVIIMRALNQELELLKEERRKYKEHLYVVHGNLFVTHVTFQLLPNELTENLEDLTEDNANLLIKVVRQVLDEVINCTQTLYPDTYLGNLFKNLKKTQAIREAVLEKMS